MIERVVDEETGIITVVATGLWTRALVDDHFAALRALIGPLRSAGRPVRILSDITGAERQSPQTEAHIQWHMESTYRRGDRIAILAADAETKSVLMEMVNMPAIAIFRSRIAAESWLLADDLADLGS